MSAELQLSFEAGRTVYFLVRNRTGSIWSTSGGTGAFETFTSVNYPEYKIAGTEQGTSGSAYYAGTMPAAVPAGVYSVLGLQQLGATAVESDRKIATGEVHWNGSARFPLSDIPVSGQIRLMRLTRGEMIQNFPIYFKSAADHVTPYTSGSVSGQIARDGGSFGPLQSGAFTEVGMGWYNLQALTSGDILANTAKLHFTASRSGGGEADPVPLALILQRSSGQG